MIADLTTNKDKVIVIIDYNNTIKGVVRGKGNVKDNITAIESALAREFNATESEITTIEYLGHTCFYELYIKMKCKEDKEPIIYDFYIQELTLY